ncbi:short-chain dehydrogenases/reductase, putative [Talaromyces stipitatus ATCC 10500]|uniref:Short-chain dehydrogenases/reductase, putative n=1 Tax=Talaromyces stipitatus (strain ATCC 10500 / CBS 375.48 / QM 6759 / NRRL 1006) TaxID=441959 RepID=B8LZN0_TALSN|nr:short-chain dehydrogenases/reductase, putative [Talaromyces stipitatus ATCC 10500]EED22453.1 short-chain dehydrogenases/reductase, putative [Talaromyces stipitatus ATCC 10500]
MTTLSSKFIISAISQHLLLKPKISIMPSFLITGASRGLGYAWVKHLSTDSNNIVIGLVRNKPATEERLAADNITNVHLVTADITDFSALQEAASLVSGITSGRLDVLINNAALVSSPISRFGSVTELSPEVLEKEFLETFKTNVIGVAHTINAFLPLIRKGDLKKVVTVSSGLADQDIVVRFGLSTSTPYSVAKAGVNMLMAKYHTAVGEAEGITFMAISPGVVQTRKPEQTPDHIKGRQIKESKFREYAPDWKGPVTAEESVKLQYDVVQKATVDTYGGSFVSQYGNKQWL